MNNAPFPTSALLGAVAAFVSETADALGVDDAFVGLPVLGALGGAIGVSREIVLKRSWSEPATIWTCVIAPSGTLKSPALDAAVQPLRDAQSEMLRRYAEACEAYERQRLIHERDLTRWRKSNSNDDPPAAPEAPTPVRCIVADCTVEALAPIIEANPRGVLVCRDELGGWLDGFNQYKQGRGSDVAQWLELHRAGALVVDRKTGDRRTIHVPRATASVTGTIQPFVFRTAMTPALVNAGLAARLLVAKPIVKTKRWTDRVPARATVEAYRHIVLNLLALCLDPPEGRVSYPVPRRLHLTDAALKVWIEFYDRHAERIYNAGDGPTAAALAKIEAYAARFALVITLAADPCASAVDADAMRAGITLAEWFAAEAERVYQCMRDDPETESWRWLTDWLAGRGGVATPAELARSGPREFRGDSEAAESALAELVRMDLGRWETSPDRTGGRPAKRFILAMRGYETHENPEFRGGFVSISSDGSAENSGNGQDHGAAATEPDGSPVPEPDSLASDWEAV